MNDAGPDADWKEIDLANETRHEQVGRPVDVLRRTDLSCPSLVHDRDPIGHGERLVLLVCHIDLGLADFLVRRLDLVSEMLAQLLVQRAQGFIKKKNGRVENQCPGYSYSLLLTAGHLVRVA